ncbi:unnamed protein product, partial [Prorocentrum cordatum]
EKVSASGDNVARLLALLFPGGREEGACLGAALERAAAAPLGWRRRRPGAARRPPRARAGRWAPCRPCWRRRQTPLARRASLCPTRRWTPRRRPPCPCQRRRCSRRRPSPRPPPRPRRPPPPSSRAPGTTRWRRRGRPPR